MAEPCPACFGNRVEVVAGKGARPCPACLPSTEAKRVALLLGKMPARYQGVTLADLQPRLDLHRDQAKIIADMQANPLSGYYFCGDNDTGKTHFLWALYQHAVISQRVVIATTLHDWIEANLARYRSDETLTTFRLSDLQQSVLPYSVFIDDVDKKKVTEYVADMFFNFVDTVYRFKHQLVVTSQLDPEKRVHGRDSLIDHFRDGDPRYGLGIARRMVNDETAVWRLF